ncbi:hypothetical protein CANARDRAFT_198580 [[Candida] arabinofermentans NRRL YB-2248]|uniref:ferric-chelate reductase (NADPH) n=1 Tax=[Candida] arabinofermentans NRRL YB-2248 TaxID=983967 RepID=A0A1E4T142_9ASCO|nr:hypothetical protein CANARDRAFT_198580 [[Candida] arabinofermentans NRRL YB-2248]
MLVACNRVLSKKYDFASNKTGYKLMCSYPPATGSFLLCLADQADNSTESREAAFEEFTDKCLVSGGKGNFSLAKMEKQYENATSNYLTSVEAKNITELYLPVRPSTKAVHNYKIQYHAFYKNLDTATYYGSALLGYFALVMIISTIFNFLGKVGLLNKIKGPMINKFRSYVTMPALLPSGRYTQPYRVFKVFSALLPNRLDSLICLGFTIMHIVIWCKDYGLNSEEDQVVFTSRYQQSVRFIADRTGVIAFAEVPLIVLFAGRNNILTFFTGFSYSSFIQFHKLVSRFMFLGAVMHSACYTIREVSLGKYVSILRNLYFRCGIVATVLCGMIMLFSTHPFRNYYYETFLYTHILMVVVFIAMCWYHCRNFGWCEWIIAACVIWFLDRVLRVVRVFSFGLHKAELKLLDEEVFKVSLKKPSHFHFKPGQYAFVYFSDPLLWFQSHPFTIMADGEDRLAFYIKAKRGITAKMIRSLKANNGSLQRTITLEGPYGHSASLQKYDSSLLIAGGSGFPGPLNHAQNLAKTDSNKPVRFVWIHQSMDKIQEFMPLLMDLKESKVQVDVYLTRDKPDSEKVRDLSESASDIDCSKHSSSEETSSEKKYSSEESDYMDYISIKYGRPDVEEIVKSELAKLEGGSLAVLACGPPIMADNLRHITAVASSTSTSRIDYFEELQTW